MTAGSGVMWLGEERFVITAGDTIAIPTGVAHAVENKGGGPPVLLCCCAPLYSHAIPSCWRSSPAAEVW
ncbi:MAG TPA: cupin domain-containing protein [Gammaproteobacteria bacterium]